MKSNPALRPSFPRSFAPHGLMLLAMWAVAACGGGTGNGAATAAPETVRLGYARYNPLSLVLKQQGWQEKDLAKQHIKVEWVLSQGSNKALGFDTSTTALEDCCPGSSRAARPSAWPWRGRGWPSRRGGGGS